MTAQVAGQQVTEAIRADAADRGTLKIDQRVVRKIVEYTADLAFDTAPDGTKTAGVGRRGSRAGVSGEGNHVDVQLDLPLRYPSPIRETVAGVRAEIGKVLERITGYHVRSIAVTVSGLRPETRSRVR
ncbi:MAG: Asp23/Gls24 family envelope stress response protein [Sciscionella sp.]